ncbi:MULTISPECIES: mechanosensitive ion channel family protein [Cysteiniphilum]|nr:MULTISPECIES: mechanosensitive ion channel domain-containing protein [Cysteiniphilum]
MAPKLRKNLNNRSLIMQLAHVLCFRLWRMFCRGLTAAFLLIFFSHVAFAQQLEDNNQPTMMAAHYDALLTAFNTDLHMTQTLLHDIKLRIYEPDISQKQYAFFAKQLDFVRQKFYQYQTELINERHKLSHELTHFEETSQPGSIRDLSNGIALFKRVHADINKLKEAQQQAQEIIKATNHLLLKLSDHERLINEIKELKSTPFMISPHSFITSFKEFNAYFNDTHFNKHQLVFPTNEQLILGALLLLLLLANMTYRKRLQAKLYFYLRHYVYHYIYLRVFSTYFNEISYLFTRSIFPACLLYLIYCIVFIDQDPLNIINTMVNALVLSLIFYVLFSTTIRNLLHLNSSENKSSHRYVRPLALVSSMIIFIEHINPIAFGFNIEPFLIDYAYARVFCMLILGIVQLILLIKLYLSYTKTHHFHSSRYGLLVLHFLLILYSLYVVMVLIGFGNLASIGFYKLLQSLWVIYIASQIARLIAFLLTPLSALKLQRIAPRKKHTKARAIVVYHWLKLIGIIISYMSALLLITLLWGVEANELNAMIIYLFTTPFPISDNQIFSVIHIINALAIFLICYVALLIIKWMIQRLIIHYLTIETGTKYALDKCLNYLVFIFAIVILIYAMGVSTHALTFIISGLSIGIGFALQDVIKNFFSGFILLIERPIKVGDMVHCGNDLGFVKHINIRTTIIETFDKNTLVIPNSLLINDKLSNETINPLSRASISIGVGYNSNPEEVRNILLQVAENNQYVFDDPKPSVKFNDFGDSALIFVLKAFVNKLEQSKAEDSLRHEIFAAFKVHNIDIPFPQLDIQFKNMRRPS